MKKVQYIVVSYKSSLKNLSRLQGLIRNLTIIDNNKKNIGYGGAANLGIIAALNNGADWVVILNQDIETTSSGIKSLDQSIVRSDSCVLGPFYGNFDRKRWTTELPSEKLDYISGSCMAIHKEVIKKVGYFYEPYFMYYEDADYCVRVKKSGFPLKSVRIKEIKHEDNKILEKGSFLLEYYLARNHMLFVERQAPLGVKVHEFLRLPKTFAEYKRNGNKGGRDGIKDYLFRKFGEKIL